MVEIYIDFGPRQDRNIQSGAVLPCDLGFPDKFRACPREPQPLTTQAPQALFLVLAGAAR